MLELDKNELAKKGVQFGGETSVTFSNYLQELNEDLQI